jgi:hypothetical protein
VLQDSADNSVASPIRVNDDNTELTGYGQQTDAFVALQGYFSSGSDALPGTGNASGHASLDQQTNFLSIADASTSSNSPQALGYSHQVPSDDLLGADPSAFDPYAFIDGAPLEVILALNALQFPPSTDGSSTPAGPLHSDTTYTPSTPMTDVRLRAVTFQDTGTTPSSTPTTDVYTSAVPEVHLPPVPKVHLPPVPFTDTDTTPSSTPMTDVSPAVPAGDGQTTSQDEGVASAATPTQAKPKRQRAGGGKRGHTTVVDDAVAPEGTRLRRNRVAFNPRERDNAIGDPTPRNDRGSHKYVYFAYLYPLLMIPQESAALMIDDT